MRLTEILKPANIKIPLESKTKSEAIAELVTVLAAAGDVTDAKKVLDAVLEREQTRTTGIGNGLAIPPRKMQRNQGPGDGDRKGGDAD